jgi:hypothetical protein
MPGPNRACKKLKRDAVSSLAFPSSDNSEHYDEGVHLSPEVQHLCTRCIRVHPSHGVEDEARYVAWTSTAIGLFPSTLVGCRAICFHHHLAFSLAVSPQQHAAISVSLHLRALFLSFFHHLSLSLCAVVLAALPFFCLPSSSLARFNSMSPASRTPPPLKREPKFTRSSYRQGFLHPCCCYCGTR